ncbi:MAG TPA: cytochrome C oxidase subunit IV family protein [Chloroflexota bacterium]|nr:cytochrome C oxidase subunit IV family protein [Chloroflexota bacterium]
MSTEHHVAHDAGGHELEHAHPGPRTYTIIGVILAVITLIEVWAYNQAFLRPALVPILLSLSAVKFATVVGFYMHLRFDNPLFLAVFGFGLAVAGSVITAFMFLFGQYPQPPHG